MIRIRSESLDPEWIEGRMAAYADHYRHGRITEYVLLVSLRILHDGNMAEASYHLQRIKEKCNGSNNGVGHS